MKRLIKKLLIEGLTDELDSRYRELRNNSHQYSRKSPEYIKIKQEMKDTKEEIFNIKNGGSVVDSDEFKTWFNGSKVVNSDGTPKVVYHGTSKEGEDNITTGGFDLEKNRFGSGGGISFMDNEEMTRPYNRGGLIRAFVRIKNPINIQVNFEMRDNIIRDLTGKEQEDMTIDDWEGYSPEINTKYRNEAVRLGYDGMYDPRSKELLVLNPKDVWVIKKTKKLS